jgi:hypothetical protein
MKKSRGLKIGKWITERAVDQLRMLQWFLNEFYYVLVLSSVCPQLWNHSQMWRAARHKMEKHLADFNRVIDHVSVSFIMMPNRRHHSSKSLHLSIRRWIHNFKLGLKEQNLSISDPSLQVHHPPQCHEVKQLDDRQRRNTSEKSHHASRLRQKVRESHLMISALWKNVNVLELELDHKIEVKVNRCMGTFTQRSFMSDDFCSISDEVALIQTIAIFHNVFDIFVKISYL